MPNSYFQFKQFIIHQDKTAMKVTTDGCLFGAIIADLPKKNDELSEVLDIGTGTGLLSLMFAQKHPDSFIDAIEIDKEAFEQATENVELSAWKDRITVIHSDVINYPFSKKYDLIFSNPPFYENEMPSTNSKKNIAHHSEGLLFDELCQIIHKNLNPGGNFYILLPLKREKHVENSLAENKLYIHEKLFLRQSTKHDYFRIILSGGLSTSEKLNTSELSICNDKMEYTNEFFELLKDYYLYL